MLDRKGQFLDFQIVTDAQQAIDANAEGVSSQFHTRAGTESSESVRGWFRSRIVLRVDW